MSKVCIIYVTDNMFTLFLGGDKEADIECIKNYVKVKKLFIKRKLQIQFKRDQLLTMTLYRLMNRYIF